MRRVDNKRTLADPSEKNVVHRFSMFGFKIQKNSVRSKSEHFVALWPNAAKASSVMGFLDYT